MCFHVKLLCWSRNENAFPSVMNQQAGHMLFVMKTKFRANHPHILGIHLLVWNQDNCVMDILIAMMALTKKAAIPDNNLHETSIMEHKLLNTVITFEVLIFILLHLEARFCNHLHHHHLLCHRNFPLFHLLLDLLKTRRFESHREHLHHPRVIPWTPTRAPL